MNKRIIIDYFAATHPLDLEGDENERTKVLDYLTAYKNFLKVDDCQIEESSYALNNFRYQYIISDFIVLRLCGPVNDLGLRTCQIELKGEGCREFERLRPDLKWTDFIRFILGFNPTFKRLDVTIDDLSGKEIKIEDVFHKIQKGYYTSVFRSTPKYHGTLDTGLTIDLGSRKSSIELCIYDKLRQQKSLGKKVDEEYWIRYEMRFRDEKADKVVLSLLQEYENKDVEVYGIDLQSFAIKALYSILDIKKDNNYDRSHQKDVSTDPKWSSFLEHTEKGILPKAEKRLSNNETRFNYIMPKAKMILLEWLLESDYDLDIFLERIVREEIKLLKETSRSQLDRLNQYLLANNKPKINQAGLDEIISTIDYKLEERSLPF